MCLIKGCDKKEFSSGLCSVHYNRLRVRGDLRDRRGDRRNWQKRVKDYFKEGEKDNCWLWTGGINKFGHGSFYIGGGRKNSKRINAHRAVWMLYNGDIPKGKQVNHKCENRHCVNPNHLYVGTQSDNMKDSVKAGNREYLAKIGRDRCGTKHHNAKLTEEQVRYIRSSTKSMRGLGRELGVSDYCVAYAKKKGWKHII